MFVKILPPQVRSRIAAGEVIGNPADVVKELVENSLDAGATRIEVEVSGGGKRLILVRDNGTGIHPEDIEKVILEGATSKIESESDLLNLTSYGFRGEALYSISSVSRLRIRSRYYQEREGRQIEVEGGRLLSVRRVGMPVGTEVEVRDLFYNLPVRRKFLRREDTERNRIRDLLREYALACPGVSFSFFSSGREILSLTGAEEEERVVQLLGEGYERIAGERDLLRVRAYVFRNARQGVFYIFVNRRPVRNRNLREFLRKVLGYRTVAVLFLELPPYAADFNVHPTKREVRFLKEKRVLSLLREILKGGDGDLDIGFLSQKAPSYRTGFRVVGQIEETIIVAQRGDYLYFFDQHLLAERIRYEELGEGSEEIACRTALKAGEPLDRERMEELLRRWGDLENPHVCPHGRPLYYRIHLKEIYEKLGRSF